MTDPTTDRSHPLRPSPKFPQPSLRGERVLLRPLREDDRARLHAILAEPSVAVWWGPGGPDQGVAELFEQADEDTTVFAIEVDGVVAGAIQYVEEPSPDYSYAGIDIFLGGAYQSRGLGSDALRTLARYLFEARGLHRLTIDPAVANERAIRTYERIGFRRVGVMRAYERGADGTWHDGLLLDMLAGELR